MKHEGAKEHKKSSFVAMIMGTVGGILSAIGMRMCLLPEWNVFIPGVIMGSIGIVVILAMALIWRRMEVKSPVRLNAKTVSTVLIGIAGAIGLGIGMCMVMVWSHMALGIIIGIAGIVVMLSLIPLIKGVK